MSNELHIFQQNKQTKHLNDQSKIHFEDSRTLLLYDFAQLF